jgi:hypothetical protein
MSFKNLRNTATPPTQTKEEIAPFPHFDDSRINGDVVNSTLDGEAEKKFGPPETLPEARPPMKLNQ